MKTNFTKSIRFVIWLSLIVMLTFATPVFALGAAFQEGAPGQPSIEFLGQLLFGLLLTVPGFTALGVVLINLLKIPGWITDGNTPIALNIFNVLAAVAIGVMTLFFPSINIVGLDKTFGELSSTLTVLLPAFVLLFKWLAPYFHSAVRGVPAFGYSFSLANKKK